MKEHRLSNNHPMLSMILALLLSTILVDTIAMFARPDTLMWFMKAAVAGIFLFIHQWWFSPEYKGVLKTEIPFNEVLKLSVPYWFMLGLSYVCNLIDYGPVFRPTATAIAMAVGAGVSEEIMIRGVTIPIGMRYLKNKNKPLVITLVTAIIFGAIHLSSLAAGSVPMMVALQIVTAICAGIFFAAVFLRTGNILITIIMHGLYDWMCFVTDPSVSSGVMTAANVTTGLIIATAVDIALAIAGLYMIRPAVRADIDAVWERKSIVNDKKDTKGEQYYAGE